MLLAGGKPALPWYIGGGIGAGVGAVLLLGLMFTACTPSVTKPSAPPDIKWGLPIVKRQRIYEQLVVAVDTHGPTLACKKDWEQIAKESGISMQIVENILNEAVAPGAKLLLPKEDWSVEKKQRRMAWILERNKHNYDPVLRMKDK